MAKADIIRKIQGLLKLGDEGRGATEAEALSAIAKAQQMLAEHNLSMADVEVEEDEEEKWQLSEEIVEGASGTKRFVTEQEDWIARATSIITGTQVIHITTPAFMNKDRRRRVQIVFSGDTADVAVACELYKFLRDTMKHLARSQFGTKWTSVHNSYAVGFAQMCTRRANQEYKPKDEKQAESLALVKFDKDAWMKNQHKNLGTAKRMDHVRKMDSDAFVAGIKDAGDIDFNVNKKLEG